MKANHSSEAIINLLTSSPCEPYKAILLYVQMLAENPAVSCFFQPSAKPKTVRAHLQVLERMSELRPYLLAHWESHMRTDGKRWSTLTVSIKAGEEAAFECTYENMERVNTFMLRKSWMEKHFVGLQFIPDKR